ncbi:MAG: FimB/Mfa2 family fimbrial subunit [Bacteroidaceae bacterium]|nr:FimB/Mfa2 family fimbrial subunit [Bacteroidaceae bacterium]
MNKTSFFSRIGVLLTLLAVVFTSCDNSFVFDDEGDCSVHYRIKFKYDRNMKFADAFAHEVTSVALYVFDNSGVLVYEDAESGEALADENFTLPVELKAGEYQFLAWCGIGDGESFVTPQTRLGVTTIEELKCRMNRISANGNGIVDKDLAPLFHGSAKFTLTDEPGVHYKTISLTKNTNVVRVILQQLSGEDVNPDLFSFEIQDYNGYMNYDNSLLDDELIIYKPWSLQTGSADINADIYNDEETRDASSVGVAVAEMTTGRLVEGNRPILVVRNLEKGDVVLSVPLIDYALLVKGNYNKDMSNQEYLDRQDEYNMTFFLDEAGRWISSSIIVNSWRVVLNNQSMK